VHHPLKRLRLAISGIGKDKPGCALYIGTFGILSILSDLIGIFLAAVARIKGIHIQADALCNGLQAAACEGNAIHLAQNIGKEGIVHFPELVLVGGAIGCLGGIARFRIRAAGRIVADPVASGTIRIKNLAGGHIRINNLGFGIGPKLLQ